MMRKLLLLFIVILVAITLFADQMQDDAYIEEDTSTSDDLDFSTSSGEDGLEKKRGTALEAKQLSIKAYKYIKENGKEKAFEKFMSKDPEFFYKDLYIFVIDIKGNMLVHPVDSSLMNKNLYNLKDSKGKYFIQNFIKLISEYENGWEQYYWRNYTTQEIESKLTYLIKIDDETFLGCGAYQQ